MQDINIQLAKIEYPDRGELVPYKDEYIWATYTTPGGYPIACPAYINTDGEFNYKAIINLENKITNDYVWFKQYDSIKAKVVWNVYHNTVRVMNKKASEWQLRCEAIIKVNGLKEGCKERWMEHSAVFLDA